MVQLFVMAGEFCAVICVKVLFESKTACCDVERECQLIPYVGFMQFLIDK